MSGPLSSTPSLSTRLGRMARECWEPACRFARTLTGAVPRSDPQDLVQEGLAKYLEKPAVVRSTTHFFQSLKHYIRYSALNARRVALALKRGKDRARLPLSVVAEELPCPGPGPLTDLVAQDRKQELLTALAGLEPEDRRLIHLAYWEQCPLVEVARRLELSCPSEARRRLVRALDRLRRRLESVSVSG